ncbi:MAG: MBL-fold metallo-hydrolase superfamily, partial [uncultured Rubrobacteraceae bacterium]
GRNRAGPSQHGRFRGQLVRGSCPRGRHHRRRGGRAGEDPGGRARAGRRDPRDARPRGPRERARRRAPRDGGHGVHAPGRRPGRGRKGLRALAGRGGDGARRAGVLRPAHPGAYARLRLVPYRDRPGDRGSYSPRQRGAHGRKRRLVGGDRGLPAPRDAVLGALNAPARRARRRDDGDGGAGNEPLPAARGRV